MLDMAVQDYFDMANARVDAKTFDEAAWRELARDVIAACADMPLTDRAGYLEAVGQMGFDAGVSDAELDAVLKDA